MTALKALAGLTKLKASAAALAGPDLPRVMANVAFSGTSLVVFACLAYSLDARRYASVGVVYVATSVATNLLRYGIFDATLAGQLDLERCRKAAQLVATVAVVGAVVVALGATIGFAGGFAPDSPLVIGAYLGSALALSADLARMLRLCDGRARFVMWGDVAWLGATMVGALVSSTAGGSLADGAVGGWVAGALVWTALVFRPRTSRSTLDGLRALAASSSMAVSGTGPFIGYLLGLVFVGALGQPAAVSVMDVGRLVGMPAITIYSGLRIGLVSRSTGDARSPLVISLVTSLALVSLTVLCVAVAPLGADSALSAAQRYWPLIWAGQAARLVTGIIGDVVRPRMPARAGVRLGALSMTLGALVPPALVCGDRLVRQAAEVRAGGEAHGGPQ